MQLDPREAPWIEATLDSQRGVLTLTFNNARKRNAWTVPLMHELRDHLERAGSNEDVRGVVITGHGTHYSAGVDLSSLLRPTNPSELARDLRDKNEELFEMFLAFPKPIAAAVNGPAIGAAVTSMLLMDGAFATSDATFSVPFARLGLSSEGCSTVTFEERLGASVAHRMLGRENWVPTAAQALEVGLIDHVAGEDRSALLEHARAFVHQQSLAGRTRRFGPDELRRLRRANADESAGVANSLLSQDFLHAMYRFNVKRRRLLAAAFFWLARVTCFLWKPAAVAPRSVEGRAFARARCAEAEPRRVSRR